MTLTDYLDSVAQRAEAATKGPWVSMRDGNQYVNTRYLPTAQVVGASRVDGIVRPWNPHALIAFGFKPQEYETARFHDADADFIAHARTDLPRLVQMLRLAVGTLGAIEDTRLRLDELENIRILRTTAADLVSSAREALADLDALAKEDEHVRD